MGNRNRIGRSGKRIRIRIGRCRNGGWRTRLAPGPPTLPSNMTGLFTTPAEARERTDTVQVTRLTTHRALDRLTGLPRRALESKDIEG